MRKRSHITEHTIICVIKKFFFSQYTCQLPFIEQLAHTKQII